MRLAWLKQKIRTADGDEMAIEGYELVTITPPTHEAIAEAMQSGAALPTSKVSPVYTDDNQRLVFLPGDHLHVMR